MSNPDSIDQLKAIRRVLELVDGYISMEKDQDLLLAWDGGVMTWREIREHIKYALNLSMLDFGESERLKELQ